MVLLVKMNKEAYKRKCEPTLVFTLNGWPSTALYDR